LDKFENNIELPKITNDTIKMIFQVLTNDINLEDDKCMIKKRGRKIEGDNLKLVQELAIFEKNVYSKLGYTTKINGDNLSQILGYTSVDMITNIENNIKMHFFDYLKCYVNGSFKDRNDNYLNLVDKNKRPALRKSLRRELYLVKQDLIENTLKSDKSYHDWIIKKRKLILPNEFKTSHLYELNKDPLKYLKYMIVMNKELELLEQKQFNFLPLRTEKTINYIPLDTKSIIEILVSKDKNKYLSNIDKYKDQLWNTYFDTENKIFKKNNYEFGHLIYTDCFAVSILFVHESQIEKIKLKNENFKKGRERAAIKYKNMNATEKAKAKELKKIEDKLKKDKIGKNTRKT